MVIGMIDLELDIITFTALAIILLLIGNYLVNKLEILQKYSIPSPVIGGFGFALFAWLAYEMNWLSFTMDTTLYDLTMYMFFVTIGLSSSLTLIKKGGKLLILYIVACWVLAVIQNGTSILLSFALKIEPLLGLMAGQPAMQGGHGMAASMAPVVEATGIEGALTVGMAAATYGLIAGSLIGGPLATWLIRRNNVKIESENYNYRLSKNYKESKTEINNFGILKALLLVFVVLAIGFPIANWITETTSFAMPGHIFSLFVGIVFRSLLEQQKKFEIPAKEINLVSIVSLELFLVMAMMNLKIWELYDLALPLIIILICQTIIIMLFVTFVLFKILGKNYDAAVMSGGFMGHGLGATPNGLMIIDAVCKHFGVKSQRAFLFIPIAGTVLTDIFGVPLFLFLVNALS